MVSSNFLDNNDEEFQSNATYNIGLRQTVYCLVCGERSTKMVDKNRCLHLSIEYRASGAENTIDDLINAYFEDDFLEGHYCDSCKSFNIALAKKVVNIPEVITCVIKRYENQKATSKRREIKHPDLQPDMSCYMESLNNTHYQLRAIIVHKEETLTTGHYTTFLFYSKVMSATML